MFWTKIKGRSKWIVAAGAVLLVLVVVTAGFARMHRGPMMGRQMQGVRAGRGAMMGGAGWHHRGFAGGWLLLLAGVGTGGYLLAKRRLVAESAGAAVVPAAAAPLEVLKLRLAEGRISVEEYDALKNKLVE